MLCASVAFYCAIWTLVFKQWQTAYELEYLFRFEDITIERKNLAIYILVNICGYGLGLSTFFAPLLLNSESMNQTVKYFVSLCLSSLPGFVYVVIFFVSSVRMMDWHVKQIPLLKRAEKVYVTTMALFFGMMGSVIVTSTIFVVLQVNNSLTNTIVILDFCLSLFALLMSAVFNLAVCHLALKFNKPLSTVKDSETG